MPLAKKNLKKVCILSSGGADSTLLICKALRENKEVYPLYIANGFSWEKAELFWLRRLLKKIQGPTLQPLQTIKNERRNLFPKHWSFTRRSVPDQKSEDDSVYLPGRNLHLLTEAAIYCKTKGIQEIWIGILKANPFPDTTSAFLKYFEKTAKLALKTSIKIRAPFNKLTKRKLFARYGPLPYHEIFSCLNPKRMTPCGNCNKCEELNKHLLA